MTDHTLQPPAPILDARGPDPRPPLTDGDPVDLVIDGDRAVAWVSGEIDVANASDVLAACGLALASPAVDALVIDVSRVHFLDSTALGMLLVLRRRAEADDTHFSLRGVTPRIARIFEITGTDLVFGLTADDPGRC